MLFPRSSLIAICLVAVFLWAGTLATTAQKKGDDKRTGAIAPPVTPFSEVRRDSLLNGLQLVTFETAAERVRCELIVHSGSMFDLDGRAGLASLTQASLLAVNPRLKEEIESLKGDISWGLDWDITWYRLEVPAAALETALEILARQVVVENVRNDALKRAETEHLERLAAARNQLSPAARADNAFLGALFRDHPYGRTIEGTEKTVAAIVQGDVYDFEKRFYLANNASVLVVGPVRHERVLRSLKLLFGGWVKGALVLPTFRQPPRTTEVRVVKVEVADLPKVELRGGVIGVKASDPDFLVVRVLSRVLEARLKRDASIQSSDRVAVEAPLRILAGPVFFSASIAPERALAFSRAATDGFAAMASETISAEELSSAKASLTSERSAMSIGDQLREMQLYALPRNYPLNFAPRIDAVTVADLQRVARRLLTANALTVVVFGPVGESFKPQT